MQNLPFPPNNDSSYNPFPTQPGTTNMPEPDIASDREAAANLIRQKLAAIYNNEPSAAEEIKEVEQTTTPLSKHQQFMQALQTSGRSLAEIQNAWHDYYMALPDEEKHEVWREFYAANNVNSPFRPYEKPAVATYTAPASVSVPVGGQTINPMSQDATVYQRQSQASWPSQPEQPKEQEDSKPHVIAADFSPASPSEEEKPAESSPSKPSVTDIKNKIRSAVSANGKLTAKSNFQSLGFGLATGAIVVFIFLFGFFNEVFITPFIQPPRQASETPVIVDTAAAPASSTPEVIIPKINVEIPVDYSETSTSEAAIETDLNSGVVHYPTTVMPGQTGNAAFFGHSSNNIFNPGKYKFAFVLLHKLTEGDTFYLTYHGKTYAYEVISHQIVSPTDIGVLGPVPDQTATATLITCDPPGTSINRLVVVGKQVSPDPSGNVAPASPSAPSIADNTPSTKLPGNGPTLWSRMWHAIF